MSRNKFIVLIALLAGIFFIMPSEGIYGSIKGNIINLLPFIMLGIIIYLIVTIVVLKKAWRKLDDMVNDENVINFAKIMNISFDVKRMFGVNHLLDLYAKVNFSKHASIHAKTLMFEALRRKRIDAPAPGQGSDLKVFENKPPRTPEEIKAARIEAAIKARKRKK